MSICIHLVLGCFSMPYKLRDNRRHKFEKIRYQINNWPAYNEALKKRGSVTLWFSDKMIKAWYSKRNKRKNRGGQFKYSNIAIQTALTIKAVYQLPYRATEGFLTSLVKIRVKLHDGRRSFLAIFNALIFIAKISRI